MALRNPSGIYQGQAPLNPLPYVNIALQARARKQAKEEAIDKYYQNLPTTINDKGVRDQEIPVINDYKNKIFEFGVKNKEALRNPKLDNGAAQFELQKLMRGAETVARLSMDAAKDDLEVGKIRLQKGNEWVVDDDEFMKDNELQNLPVTDPRFKKIDINKILQGRPFDLSKQVKDYADIKMGEGEPTITPHPQDPLLEIVKTNPVFDEETKKTLYARAVNDYHNKKSFEKQINKITSPEEIAELNEISKRTFGHPIREDFAGEDAAAAFMVRALAPKPTVQKVRPNVQAAFDYKRKAGMEDWVAKNKITYAQSLEKIRQNRAAGQVPEDLGYISDNVSEEVGEDVPVKDKNTGKVTTKRFVDITKVDPERLNIIIGKDPSKKMIGAKATEVVVKNPDGTTTTKKGYYVDPNTGDWEGAEGQKASREAAKDRYVKSMAGTKFKAQSGTKASENTNKKLDPTGFKKEGKYWRYKDGRLFDDAGKVIKQ